MVVETKYNQLDLGFFSGGIVSIMSRLVPKLSPLIHKNRRSVRLLSSSRTGPCVSVCNVVQPSPDGGNIGEVLLYDVAKFELVRTEKTFPDELHEAQLVGASRGWGFFFNREDRSVVISDFLNPYASKTEPKMFPLPMFTSPGPVEALGNFCKDFI
ncbi:hypothetical protein F2Q70_00021285 [Brassica cretica]|uniref:Uncharacterized protein n=1 Tax=Brassica cretica TaxID=69181 RepID=A0A8S9HPI1_BRACR|nr:hypothetical protein F2Q70_00021285 [Brassica cretica]KAF2558462.1 hypothetical protein F2Q68_00014763 [Brassica cretica]